jgi:signal peptidase I
VALPVVGVPSTVTPEAAPEADESETTKTVERPTRRSHSRRVIEWTAVLGGALLVALLIKVLLFQAFMIPSESMTPTLKVGDRVLVNKLSYRLHDIHRGDVVVFARPPAAKSAGDDSDLIKRVIGLPGDTLEGSGGVVVVNDKTLDEPYLPPGVVTGDFPRTTVGPGQIFVMGDNRSNSRDSRFFGPVPESLVVGRAFVKVWPLSGVKLF